MVHFLRNLLSVLGIVAITWGLTGAQPAAILHQISDPATPRVGQYWLSTTTSGAVKFSPDGIATRMVWPQELQASTLAGLGAAGTAGLLKDVTDSIGGIHKDTGTQWIQISGKIVNVQDRPFDAKCDGVTDDRAAVQAAIDAAGIGGAVIIPQSTNGCRLGSTSAPGVALKVDGLNGIKIFGGGYRSCMIVDAGPGVHGMHITNSSYYTLRDFCMIGLSGSTGDGIRVGGNTTLLTKPNSGTVGSGTNNSHYGVIDNVWVNGFGGAQIAVLGGQTTRILHAKINLNQFNTLNPVGLTSAQIGNPRYGIYIGDGGQSNSWQCTACQVEGTGYWGLVARGTLNGKIIGGIFEGNSDNPDPTPINIASSTNTTPISITTATPHGYAVGGAANGVGRQVLIAGHTVNTNANGIWDITTTGTTTFTLDGSIGNGVGGATGTSLILGGDIYLLSTTGTFIASAYSETAVVGGHVRNLMVRGGWQDRIENFEGGGGTTHITGNSLNVELENFHGNSILIDTDESNDLTPSEVYLKNVTYGLSAGSFTDNGTETVKEGLINGSNDNQQAGGTKRDSHVNFARNGSFERWISATSLDGAAAGGWSPFNAATVARIGDGEATTDKFHGHYAVAVTSGNPTSSGIVYQGPTPTYANIVGKLLTVSVWARTATGTEAFDIQLSYDNGAAIHQQSFTATTTWTKYSASFPVLAGRASYDTRLLITSGTGKVIRFDAFSLTLGYSAPYGEFDNLKQTEPEPVGHHTLTFSATPTIRGDVATHQTMVITGNVTVITLSNGLPGQPLTLRFVQGGGGGFTVGGWPGTVRWMNGTAPTAPTAVGAVLEVFLAWDGTNWNGSYPTVLPLVVGEGGTGATTLTDGGILLGSGTGAVTSLGVASNGQIPIGDGTTDPVLGTISGTANEITVTNGAGTITLDLPNQLTVPNQAVIVDAATTFALTSDFVTLDCTGPETINTITGGVVGEVVRILHRDTECTLADDDDPTAADAINLTGVATNDVGAADKIITLLFDGTHWLQASESAN